MSDWMTRRGLTVRPSPFMRGALHGLPYALGLWAMIGSLLLWSGLL